MNTAELLKFLSRLNGPSGFEADVIQKIKDSIEGDADKVEIDRMGNLIAWKNPGAPSRVGIFAHADEIGAVVSKIEENGFVRISPVGGVDIRTWLAHRVRIFTSKGPVMGVIGVIAPHLTGAEVKDHSFDNVFVNVLERHEEVRVGDPVILDVEPVEINGKLVSGKALDNRAGCATSIKALKLLKKYVHRSAAAFVFNTTEEVGGPGAQTSAYRLNLTHAIVVETTHADEKTAEVSEVNLGGGPVIGTGPSCDPDFTDLAIKTAEELKIPYQIEALPGRSGTDSDNIQLVRSGVKTLIVSIPLKYMHTPCEVVSVDDVELSARLIAEIVTRL